ncbi:MAG TPA: hypothetical protein VHO03_17345 [Ignavibacteriales bacterium]|nr:hypothetical protein [Ignavibacteriales bacterium]
MPLNFIEALVQRLSNGDATKHPVIMKMKVSTAYKFDYFNRARALNQILDDIAAIKDNQP